MKPQIFINLMLAALIIGCDINDIELFNSAAPASVLEKAQNLISGTVREVENDVENGVAAWKIEIITNLGAEVEIYCAKQDSSLLRIDGESGPFSYNIDPGQKLLSFADAKNIVENLLNGTIEEWRLRMEDEYNDRWVYRIEVEGPDGRVEIDAETGNVLELKD